MSDLPPAGPAQAPRLAGGVGREVVVVDEALGLLRVEAVQALLLAGHAQGGDSQDLSLAPREEARTVGSRREAHLAGDGPDVPRAASVGAYALAQDVRAHLGPE